MEILFYVDTCLSIGYRSAPYLFNHALHWILEQNYGVDYLLHNLDNIFTADPADSSTCEENRNAMLAKCEKLNVPIKPSKVFLTGAGSNNLQKFLGIHFNTTSMEASITSERKQALLQELSSLHTTKMYKKRIAIPNW